MAAEAVLVLTEALAKLPITRRGVPLTPFGQEVRKAARSTGFYANPYADEFREIEDHAASCGELLTIRLDALALGNTLRCLAQRGREILARAPDLVTALLAPRGALWIEWPRSQREHIGEQVFPPGAVLLLIGDGRVFYGQIYSAWKGDAGPEAAHARVFLPIPDGPNGGHWRTWLGYQTCSVGEFGPDDLKGLIGLTTTTGSTLRRVSGALWRDLRIPGKSPPDVLAAPFVPGPSQRVPALPGFVLAVLHALGEGHLAVGPRGQVSWIDRSGCEAQGGD